MSNIPKMPDEVKSKIEKDHSKGLQQSDEGEGNHSIEKIYTTLSLESYRLREGFKLANDIHSHQKEKIQKFEEFFLTLIAMQFIFLGAYIIFASKFSLEIDSLVLVSTISALIIETIAITSIMVKYIFSSQTKDIIAGLYNNELSKHSNISDVDKGN